MSQQSLKRTAAGLVTNPNAFSETPEGALAEAVNCVCDRPGITSKRRGFERYGLAIEADGAFEYRDRVILRERATGTLFRDTDGAGTWGSYSGTHGHPDATSKMRAVDSQNTLYLTTAAGIVRTDSLSTAPARAGIAPALDMELSRVGTGGGWLPPNSQVGYRHIWGRQDSNGRILRGAPSMREVVTNTPTGTLAWARSGAGPYTITVTHTAHGYTTGDIVEIDDSTAAGLNGPRTITVTTANAYTFSVTADPGASGTLVSGKRFNVLVKVTLPDDVRDGDFIDIYRTAASADASADPGDRQLSVTRHTLTGTGVSFAYAAGVVTVTHASHGMSVDDVIRIYGSSDSRFDGTWAITGVTTNTYTYNNGNSPPATGSGKMLRIIQSFTDDWDLPLSDELYTNPQQQGILKAESRPPWARDMAMYRGIMHYLGFKREHYLPFQLVDVAGLVSNTSSLTVTAGAQVRTFIFSNVENPAARKFLLSASSLISVQLADTMKSFCRVVNRDPGSIWNAWYISGLNDAPGQVVLMARKLDAVQFRVEVNDSTTAADFYPTIPVVGATSQFLSDNQFTANGLAFAKVDQPEAVPDLDWDPIGDDSVTGLRILPTRDSLFIITDEGLWRKSGQSAEGFYIEPLDLTIKGVAPESWCVGDNAVWGLCTGGVIRASEGGTQLVSFATDDFFSQLITWPNRDALCRGVFYESASSYIIWVPKSSTSTRADWAFVYNTLTKEWAGPWERPSLAALVKKSDDKLYHAFDDDTVSWLSRERKSFSTTDYSDEELPAQITAVAQVANASGEVVTAVTVSGIVYGSLPVAGWAVRRDPSALPYMKAEVVETLSPGVYRFILDGFQPSMTTGTAMVAVAIRQRIRWIPEAAGNVTLMKQFQSMQVYLESGKAIHHKLGFSTDLVTEEVSYGEIKTEQSPRGVLVREIVPSECQRARALNFSYENDYAFESADVLQVSFDFNADSAATVARHK